MDRAAPRSLEARFRTISRLYAFLSRISRSIAGASTRDDLLCDVCRVAVGAGGFRMAWAGLLDEASGAVHPLANCGIEDGYLDGIAISARNVAAGNGPTGTALREGTVVVCDDIRTDPRMVPWRDEAVMRGYRSSAAVPFRQGGAVVGTLNLYAEEPDFFTLEERVFLEEIGTSLSFALDAIAARQALREREERLRFLSENLADCMVYQIDSGMEGARRRFTYLSPAVGRFHGLEVEDVLRDPQLLYRQLVEEDRARLARMEAEAFAGRKPLDAEVRVRLASGELRWRRFVSAPRLAPDGCLLWDGIEQDITDRKQAEEQVRQSEKRFRDIVESLGNWYWEMDAAGRLTFSSEHCVRVLGRGPAELLGHSPVEFAAPDDMARQRQYLVAHGTPPRPIRDFEGWYLLPDGTRVCIAVSGVPVLDQGGALVGWRGVARDVTERMKAAEERLRMEAEVQRALRVESLGVLAGGVAHDFNNLLAAVLGNAELALAGLPPEAAARESVEQIQKAALHAADLTRQMLAYAGRGSFATRPVSVQAVVRDMSQFLASSISKRHALILDLAEAPTVEADPAQLRQIVMNLVINASEAIGEPEGVISVRAAPLGPGEDVAADVAIGDLGEGGHVHLEVTDTGEGMDAATLSRIFDPFFTTKLAGRGLGLAAVIGIVRRHGAALRVRSRPGSGSAFSVLFPANEGSGSAPAAAARADRASPWCGSGTVLLVDDEEPVRTMASRMLRALGFEVVVAADGMEALARLGEEGGRIRAVLLDLTMPRMDGEATLREIRSVSPKVPVVLCSGYDVLARPERFAGLAFSEFLQKPFRLSELERAVRRALGE